MSESGKRKLSRSAVGLLTGLASVATILVFVMTYGEQRRNALDPCVDVIGQWDWLATGGVVSIAEGGTASWRETQVASAPSTFGAWTCSEKTGDIEIRWSTGFTDNLEVVDNGERLSGRNGQGVRISATRVR